MPQGRQPTGEHALSNAERQARYRARRQAGQPLPKIRYRRPADRRTRAQRWCDTVAELVVLQAEYAAWNNARLWTRLSLNKIRDAHDEIRLTPKAPYKLRLERRRTKFVTHDEYRGNLGKAGK
jgi:hypothetical protein